MSYFNQEKYFEKYIENKQSHERKQIKFFFTYLLDKLQTPEIEEEDFSLLSKEDLLESLDLYIRSSKITARQTASAYIGNLRKLYSNLSTDYQIHNDIYVNGKFLPEFYEEARTKILILNDTVDKETATDEEYDSLMSKIREYEVNYSYEDAVKGIDKYIFVDKENALSDGLDMFRHIRSVCATLLVVEFGFKNTIIRHLKIEDIDLNSGTISRKKYKLQLSNNLKNNLREYIKIREYLLTKLEKKQNMLFISRKGDSFINKQDYANKLFGSTIGKLSNSVSTERFARKCLIRMINQGFNSVLIKEITGYADDTYKQVCESENNNVEYVQNKLMDFVVDTSSKKVKTKRKGYIDCPICGKPVKAISDELVLIKKIGDTKLYLACKKCGGKNV